MVVLVIIAVLLAFVAAVYREYCRISPSTPAAWARQWAEQRRAARDLPLAIEYKGLADGFERIGATWEEATYYGPFTDLLSAGQHVIAQLPAKARPTRPDGAWILDAQPWTIRPGTNCVVARSSGSTEDDCRDGRGVEVRFLDGPFVGKTATIKRVYFRRGVK